MNSLKWASTQNLAKYVLQGQEERWELMWKMEQTIEQFLTENLLRALEDIGLR